MGWTKILTDRQTDRQTDKFEFRLVAGLLKLRQIKYLYQEKTFNKGNVLVHNWFERMFGSFRELFGRKGMKGELCAGRFSFLSVFFAFPGRFPERVPYDCMGKRHSPTRC